MPEMKTVKSRYRFIVAEDYTFIACAQAAVLGGVPQGCYAKDAASSSELK